VIAYWYLKFSLSFFSNLKFNLINMLTFLVSTLSCNEAYWSWSFKHGKCWS